MSYSHCRANLRILVSSLCFGIAAVSVLMGVTAAARAQAEHPIQATKVLGIKYEQIESVLGKPGLQKGEDGGADGALVPGSAYFKVPGVLRLITAPGTTGDIKGLVEFQFSKSSVKDWKTAARIIGLDPAKATNSHGHWEWSQLPGWSVAWNPKSFSGPRDPLANALVFVGPEIGLPWGDPDIKSRNFREEFLH